MTEAAEPHHTFSRPEQASMRALVFHTFGGPEVLSMLDLPVPEPQEGEVRVKVVAAPVFSADVAARSGAMAALLPRLRYYMLGWELAGIVDAAGTGVNSVKPGDPVVGVLFPMFSRMGAQAEFAVLPTSAVAKAPRSATLVEASTVPANALTAYQALDALALPSGASLAVTGAAGAVGGYALELAALRRLRVFGLASEEDREFVQARGATFVPRSQNPAKAIRSLAAGGVDALIDAAGLASHAIGAVKDGGAVVVLKPPAAPPAERNIRVVPMMVHPNGAQLGELVHLVDQGALTTRVARTFRLEEAKWAHELYGSPGLRGRLVLLP